MGLLRDEPAPMVEAEPDVEWAEPKVAVAEEEPERPEEEPEPPEEAVAEEEPEPPPTSRFVHPEDPPQAQSRFPRSDEGGVSLRSATFEDLRDLGMSVTQARRVLHYRDERGLDSVAGLEEVPGLPRDFRAELAQKLND